MNPPPLPLRCHHIGLVGANLDRERRMHSHLGFIQEGTDFFDATQRVRGCFMVNNGMRIELLEPTDASSPVQAFLRRNIRMYHQAFEVDDLDASMQALAHVGARPCGPRAAAPAFAGREIVFLMLPTDMIVELIASPVRPTARAAGAPAV